MTDMLIKENKPTDRVQVLNEPAALPHKCAGCGAGAGKDRTWIDFGISVELYGALYVCSFCINEVCNALNYASPEQTSKMLNQIKMVQAANRRLESERNALRTAIYNLSDGGVPISITLDESEQSPDTLPFSDGNKASTTPKSDVN